MQLVPLHVQYTCAEDNKLSNPEVYSAIRNNFYMNDYLQSFKTTETAAITATDKKDTLQKGGFKLTQFFSNDPNTVMKITGENADTAIEQRILGQTWNAKEDIFVFKRPDLKLDVKTCNNVKCCHSPHHCSIPLESSRRFPLEYDAFFNQ